MNRFFESAGFIGFMLARTAMFWGGLSVVGYVLFRHG